jgi:exosortase/archaeosortase family protein
MLMAPRLSDANDHPTHRKRMTVVEGRTVLAFVGRFAAAWLVALCVLALVPAGEQLSIRATIWSLAWLSRVFHMQCVVSGSFLRLAGADLEIVGDCTSLMPTLTLWAAVIAFPAGVLWKGAGLTSGAVVLWFYNLARVLALAFVLRVHPTWFEFVHAYLWQTLTLLIVLAMFIGWIVLEPRRGKR